MINELELLQYKDWTQCQGRICADLWTLLVYFSDCERNEQPLGEMQAYEDDRSYEE